MDLQRCSAGCKALGRAYCKELVSESDRRPNPRAGFLGAAGEAERTEARLDLSTDLTGFFRGVVAGAIKTSGYQPTEAAELYVAELLTEYARPVEHRDQVLNRPLTLLLDEAQKATGAERFERLRTLGDNVLYVSGFFADHLENRGVELGYVAMLGATAYESAAQMLRGSTHNGRDGATDVFSELADEFQMFVSLLGDVASSLLAGSVHSERELVRVYERWHKTGSNVLAQTLLEHGMVPVRGSGTVH